MKPTLLANLVWFCIISSNLCLAQGENPRFKHLTADLGLSQSHINAIIEDKKGFMWFASEDGLNKYDGYKFTHYKHDAGDQNSISESYVNDLIEDKAGNLWIATPAGLDRFLREKNTFVHYSAGNQQYEINTIFQDSKNRIWLGTNQGLILFNANTGKFTAYPFATKKRKLTEDSHVYRIAEDSSNALWLATEYGLYRFEINSGKSVGYFNDAGDKTSIGSNWIKALCKDREGNMWIGTHGGGLSLYNAKSDSFRNFLHNPNNSNSIAHNDILTIMDGKDSKLWIGTENGGISLYDISCNQFSTYQQDANDETTLNNNSVYCIYRDRAENLWIGTYAGGVNFLPRFGEKFVSYHQIPFYANSLSNNIVLAICGDSTSNNIWLGTDGGGLDLFDRKTKIFTHYRHNNSNINSISNDYVISIVQVSKDVLGLGFHNGGFDLFNIKTNTFTHHMPKAGDPNSLSISDVNNLFRDRDGNLWIGTWKGGLNFYDAKSGKIKRYRTNNTDKASISDDIVTTVFQDKKGNIWVGTYNGLNLLDGSRRYFKHYKNDPKNKQSISHNKIQTIREADNGNLWIGTEGGGLNYFDIKKQTFKTYSEKDGLASNIIFGILKDARNNLWISTTKGISKFNPSATTFLNFDPSDGLQGNEFRGNSCFKTLDGEMFFGGVNGFTAFKPEQQQYNTHTGPVYITDFLIFNKKVGIGNQDAVLSKDITETQSITLSYDQSVFSFEFAALNYNVPEKNQYAYKLDGFDKEWNYIGNKRSATYTNLDPGTYTFRVKASNNDRIWNLKDTFIKIKITPPFWQTWWFRSAVILGIVGMAIAFYRNRTQRILTQRKELKRLVDERTRQLSHAIEEEKKAVQTAEMANRAKSSFMATMSHEIRTPMNGVIGLAALLVETPLNAEQLNYTKSIQACGEDLLSVINDILDFSKVESGNMQLEYVDFNIRVCIEEIMDLISAKANLLSLELIYQIDSEVPPAIVADSHRLRQVLLNLLGNAIKFTSHGQVFLRVHLVNTFEDGTLELGFDIHDTGIGIADDKMDRLFKSFSQVDSSTTREYGGTGLGLVICEKLVGLMGGTIGVNSVPGEGSTFYFSIRTRKSNKPLPLYMIYNMTGFENSKILIIAENETNGKILGKQIQDWKLIPFIAQSAGQALDILAKKQDFSLVITDTKLIINDNNRLSTSIQKNIPQVPIIGLSSKANESENHNPGLFAAILTKPVKQNTLSRHIFIELSKQKKSDPNPPAFELPASKLQSDFSSKYPLSILVAEDNKVNQIVILNILQKLGYSADLATDGLEAFQKTSQKAFDVILMDIQMPVMDGLEATRLIKRHYPTQPFIIAMTANAFKQDQESCIEAGMDDYLSKPVELKQLINMLEKWALKLHNPVV